MGKWKTKEGEIQNMEEENGGEGGEEGGWNKRRWKRWRRWMRCSRSREVEEKTIK